MRELKRGYVKWELRVLNLKAILKPKRFAAIVPISSGAISPQRAQRLNKLPIWVAHGDNDTIIPIEESKRIVDSLKTHNTNIIFRVYKGAGHEVCTTAYEEPELFEWLLKQRNKVLNNDNLKCNAYEPQLTKD